MSELRRRQGGEGNVGCVLWLLLFAVAGLICYKAIPVKINTAEFYDFIVDQAKFAGTAPSDAIKKSILQKAKEMEIPLDEKNLSVEKIADKIRVRCKFTIPLEFPAYTYEWNFNWEIERPIYII